MTSVIHPIISPVASHALTSNPTDLSGGCVLSLHTPYIDISGGKWYDASVGRNPGSIVGASRPNDMKGLYFDGIDDYVGCGDDAGPQLNGELTFSAWILAQNGGNNPLISWKSGSITPSIYYCLSEIDPIIFLGSNNYKYFNGNCAISDEKWHHVAVIITGVGQNDIDDSKFYIDGVELTINFLTKTGTVTPSDTTLIGKTSDHLFKGSMNEVSIYNRTLSENEIITIYNQSKRFYQ